MVGSRGEIKDVVSELPEMNRFIKLITKNNKNKVILFIGKCSEYHGHVLGAPTIDFTGNYLKPENFKKFLKGKG